MARREGVDLVGSDGSRRIGWMIIGTIKAHPTESGWQGKPMPDDRWRPHRGDLTAEPGARWQ
jgi:hypothetical protein